MLGFLLRSSLALSSAKLLLEGLNGVSHRLECMRRGLSVVEIDLLLEEERLLTRKKMLCINCLVTPLDYYDDDVDLDFVLFSTVHRR